MPDVDVVVTCKGRLAFLKKTLPTLLRQSHKDIGVIIVDYNCPDGTARWVGRVRDPRVRAVRADVPEEYWNLAKARNLGARDSLAPVLLFWDADSLAAPNLVEYSLPATTETSFCTYRENPGNLMVRRTLFESVGRYNEKCEGWGYEDTDLLNRLRERGCEQQRTVGLLTQIHHDDALRNRFHRNKPLWQTEWENVQRCYASGPKAGGRNMTIE